MTMTDIKTEQEFDNIIREQLRAFRTEHGLYGEDAALFVNLKILFFLQRIDAKLTEVRNDLRYLKDEHNRIWLID